MALEKIRRAFELGILSVLKYFIYKCRIRIHSFSLNAKKNYEISSLDFLKLNLSFKEKINAKIPSKLLNFAFDLNSHILWNIAQDGSIWGLRPSFNYPMYCKNECDIKITWELNRHQFFCQLALIYLKTKNIDYLFKLKEHFSGWINQNPVGKGVNWASSLEISIRLISWLLTIDLIKNELKNDKETQSMILRSFIQQSAYLSSHISPTYKPTNNHIIGECCGLAIIGIVLSDFSFSRGWLEKSLKILDTELRRQIYPDGVSYECSASYHRFVLDFLLLLIVIAQKCNFVLSESVIQKTEVMLEYLVYLLQPDGKAPMIGDSDDGRAWKLTNYEDYWDFSTCLAIGSILYNKPELKYRSSGFSDDAHLILSEKNLETYESMPSQPPCTKSKVFEFAGIAILRNGWRNNSDYLLLRYGNSDSKYPRLDSHVHCDFLSVILYLKGIPIFVDSGTYTYNGPKEWRDYFRLTSAHNTVRINKMEQMAPSGIFSWDAIPNGKLMSLDLSDEYDRVIAQHDGYRRLMNPLVHQREIEYFKIKSMFKITDTLYANGDYLCEWFFHVHPHLEVVREADASFTFKRNSYSVAKMKFDDSISHVGVEESFYSEYYNEKISNRCIHFAANVTISTELRVSFEIASNE
jgi:hypothetical protein